MTKVDVLKKFGNSLKIKPEMRLSSSAKPMSEELRRFFWCYC